MAERPPRRRESPGVRREQILDAAEQVLLERGLASATMADVAAAAGVAKGTVYLYYESKADLLAELRARYLDRFVSALAAPQGRTRSAAGAINQFVEGLFDFSVANRALHHLLFHEAGYSEDDAFAGARVLLAGLIAAGSSSGEFDVVDEALTTEFIMHGVHGALVSVLQDTTPDRRRFVARTSWLVKRTLTTP
jgi:TetR/AcrR family transcriptional regulator, transcriptional repressor for nem operon